SSTPAGWKDDRSMMTELSVAVAATLYELIRTHARDHRLRRTQQNPGVEPERPVVNVVCVRGLGALQVRLAAVRHLPEAGDAGRDLMAQIAKLLRKLRQVVVG